MTKKIIAILVILTFTILEVAIVRHLVVVNGSLTEWWVTMSTWGAAPVWLNQLCMVQILMLCPLVAVAATSGLQD